MSENPVDLVWLIAGAALAAVFGLAGPVLAVYAVRRRYPVLGAVLGVLAVAVFGVMVVASGFLAIVLLLLCSAMDELSPAEGSAGPLGTIAGPLCFMNSTPRQAEIRRAPAVKREAEEDWGKARGR